MFSFTFYLILNRILDDRTYKKDFNEEFHKLDLSAFLVRGSERVLAYFDAFEMWSTSTFDSHLRSFVPGTCKHYLTRNKCYIYSVGSKAMFFFTLLRSGDVHPHPGPTNGNNTVGEPRANRSKVKTRQPQFPWVACGKGVIKTSKAVDCDQCSRWTHIKCSGFVSEEMYQNLISSDTHSFSYLFGMLSSFPAI